MKVKELIKLLSDLDDDALVVTSSNQHYSWGYHDISEIELESLYQNGKIYEISKDDKDSKKSKVSVVILRS